MPGTSGGSRIEQTSSICAAPTLSKRASAARTSAVSTSANRRMLFPVSLVGFQPLKEWECFDAEMGKDSAVEIREFFIPDFSTWKTNHDAYQENFDRLLKSLQTIESTTAAQA